MLAPTIASADAPPNAPSVALHYGKHPPLNELSVFDIVVVEPDHGADPAVYKDQPSRLYAYVSVGEIHPTRSYTARLPAAWQRGIDPVWKSVLVDVSQVGYADFFAEQVVGPLWQKGYRGFFLDTLDSYRRIPASPAARDAQDAAMQSGTVRVIETLARRFPGIRLIANRGFEILPAIAPHLEMVAAESLFRAFDAKNENYVEVSAADRKWTLGQLTKARDTYGLPVLAIDYVAPADRTLARQTAEKIRALGIVPWVTDGALESIGIGAWEVLPRKVLMLYDGSEAPVVDETSLARFYGLPLEYLGYIPAYHDINLGLPTGPLQDRYAGIVMRLNRIGPQADTLVDWLQQRKREGTRIAIIGQLGFALEEDTRRAFGLGEAKAPSGALSIVAAATDAKMFGFESRPRPARHLLQTIRIDATDPATRPLLTLSDPRGEHTTAAAIMPWGGFVLEPFTVVELAGSDQTRWVVDPFAFLKEALALPPMPAPDVTTENGRRLFFVHIDGDGYPSLAEIPGSPFAGAVLRDQVIKRYQLPTTMSVIEAEVAPHGLYPQFSAELEAIARDTFALPYVEIASHTYSHPYFWYRAEFPKRKASQPDLYHLDIPGYAFDLKREIEGSMAYIRERLAPPGKPVEVFLWSGDAAPTATALAIAEHAGFLNMNGGFTVATRAYPSLTAVTSMGIERGGVFQPFAPIMNENVYTNLWTGPYYGFQNVIETFEITGAPRRLKPINIYYHTYSASKPAGLSALERIYQWSLAQSPHPVFGSDYIRKVRDFRRMAIAREVGNMVGPQGGDAGQTRGPVFRVRGHGDLRTLRLPDDLPAADLAASSGIAGQSWSSAQPEARYAHLSGNAGQIAFASTAAASNPAHDNFQKNGSTAAQPTAGAAQPFLFDANARLRTWTTQGARTEFTLAGHLPLEFTLGHLAGCRLIELPNRPLTPTKKSQLAHPRHPDAPPTELAHFRLDHAAGTFATICGAD